MPLVGEGTGPGASFLGASRDATVLYFTSSEVLTGSEANQHGEVAQAGETNLYVRNHGTTKLVAVLTPGDTGNSRVSPDGEWLALMTDRSLTGYDNRDAISGEADQEVYLYHNNTSVHALTKDDARPEGPAQVYRYDSQTKCSHVSRSARKATTTTENIGSGDANIPGWTPYRLGKALYQSLFLT